MEAVHKLQRLNFWSSTTFVSNNRISRARQPAGAALKMLGYQICGIARAHLAVIRKTLHIVMDLISQYRTMSARISQCAERMCGVVQAKEIRHGI
jgi:hypothetical protein